MPEVDGVLVEWGDRLYRSIPKGRSPQATVCGHKAKAGATAGSGRGGQSAAAIRQKLLLTVKKAPEVMVKVTGGGKCMSRIKAHFDYISRNGEVPIENEAGQVLIGKEAVRELRDDWRLSADGATIPPDVGYRREAFNIVLSMPPGTDREAVKSAARDFAAENFSKHQYVFAAHEDEQHPHVHLCVKAVGRDMARLNPRKADLQQWRESFAERLRCNGIEANATPRAVRGVTRRRQRHSDLHLEKRGVTPRNTAVRNSLAAQDAKNAIGPSPYADAAKDRRKAVLAHYSKVAGALALSDQSDDRKLAISVAKYVQTFQEPKIAHQLAVEALAGVRPSAAEKVSGQGRDRG